MTELLCGYHTAVLEDDLLLRPGQMFSVTVMMTALSDTADFSEIRVCRFRWI